MLARALATVRRPGRRHRLLGAVEPRSVSRGACSNVTPPEEVVEVYIDVKSPHAYLVLGPALQLQQDYRCRVDFLAYELSFLADGMGLTTKMDGSGGRHPPTANADRRAKMFYATAREYAQLQGIKIRGPPKLLNSRLGNLGLMFARERELAAPFLAHIFAAGWPNGWREFNLESPSHIQAALDEVCGAEAAGSFAEYSVAGGAGDRDLQDAAEAADASGCVGVPHLAWVGDDGKKRGLFGREHLSLVRRKLHEKGLARREAVEPDISHAWVPPCLGPI